MKNGIPWYANPDESGGKTVLPLWLEVNELP